MIKSYSLYLCQSLTPWYDILRQGWSLPEWSPVKSEWEIKSVCEREETERKWERERDREKVREREREQEREGESRRGCKRLFLFLCLSRFKVWIATKWYSVSLASSSSPIYFWPTEVTSQDPEISLVRNLEPFPVSLRCIHIILYL